MTTPDLGLNAGLDVGIFKDLGLSIGYARMRVEEAAGAVEFNAAVPEGVKATHTSNAGCWFIGLSYKVRLRLIQRSAHPEARSSTLP